MIVVLICADIEWKILLQYYPSAVLFTSLLGEWFESEISHRRVVFFHGGWGKIHSASSTQYCIDQWHPSLVINLGTCGGIQGRSNVGELIMADRTVVYDIYERMGDPQEAIQFYTSDMDRYGLELNQFPQLRYATIVSADRDLAASELEELVQLYDAVAGDWESGSIAFVTRRNKIPCIIIRGVSDVVGETGSAAYQNILYFEKYTEQIMKDLLVLLPQVIKNITI